MNNTMKNLKDEIEGIMNEHSYKQDVRDFGKPATVTQYKAIDLVEALTSLIEQEKERAVREFAVWVAREKYDLEIFHDLEQFLKESESQAETEDKAVSMLLTLLQPKTTSTDMEELRKLYNERFTYGGITGTIALTTDNALAIWNFFAPHLAGKSESKKEAYEQGVKDEANRWLNQPANEHDKRIKKEAVRGFAKWLDLDKEAVYKMPHTFIQEWAEEYLSSNEKNSKLGGKE